MTKELNIVSTHPGPVAVVTWEIPPALERLYEAQQLGRMAYIRGKECRPAEDADFKELHEAPNTKPTPGVLRDAWRIGWHEAKYADYPTFQHFLGGDPLAREQGRAVVALEHDLRRCSCPPEHYHGETDWSCCNECGLPMPEKS
jgi:hypothetical protein